MRETYSSLLQTTKDFCVDDDSSTTSGLSATSTLLARLINHAIQFIFSKIKNYKTQPSPKTMKSVEDQIYYHYPPGFLSIESITMAIGDVDYPLTVVNSQQKWDELQQLDIASSEVPQYYFPRQSDFGIYPTPNEDDLVVTLVGNYLPQRMSVADYTTGTVAVVANSATVTGTDTAFTAAMVGRWFCEITDGLPTGNWYRISSYASATVIGLESVFEETSLSGASFVIAQSPELPEEVHEFIAFRAAATYYATIKRNPGQAQALLNYFWTGDFGNPNRKGKIEGGLAGVISEYKNTGRSNSQIVQIHGSGTNKTNEIWATTLSEA